MTALPEWMVGGLTAADYEALPEEICRQIEVIDGAIVVNPTPRRIHRVIVRRFANALEAARGTQLGVATDVDLRIRDIPLLNRCPDIVVYDSSLPDDEVLRPPQCRLVAEIMSPNSVTTDQIHKPAEYAAAGIEHFWRVEFDDQPTLFRYRLDPTTRCYAPAGVHTGKMVVTDPLDLSVDLDQLF